MSEQPYYATQTEYAEEHILRPAVDPAPTADLHVPVQPLESGPDNSVQSVQPVQQVKYHTPFSAPDESLVDDLDLTQRLPNILLTNEDLERCYSLCQDRIKVSKNDPEITATLQDIMDSYYHISLNTYGSEFCEFFQNNARKLVQYVLSEKGHPIRIGYPTLNLGSNMDNLTGKTASRYVNQILGTGRPTGIPLWHSGLIFTIDPFSEQEILELNITLERFQMMIGLHTRGASFTGDDIHVNNTLVDFILDHVVDCNLKAFDRTSLKKLMLSSDIPALLTGALATIYPSGYPVSHSCVNTEAGTCNYNLTSVRKENGDYYPDSLLDFTKVLWVDESLLDVEALLFMSARPQSHTYEEIKLYQAKLRNKLTGGQKVRPIWSRDDRGHKTSIGIAFKTPSVVEYALTSLAWIANVKKMAEAALNGSNDSNPQERERQRNKVINRYAAVTDLVKHMGWIDYLVITDPDGSERIISEDKSVKKALEQFISAKGFKTAFEEEAQKYKESTLIAWPGLPNWECPSCHCGQTDPSSPRPSLYPINMSGYFFSTMVWRSTTRHNSEA